MLVMQLSAISLWLVKMASKPGTGLRARVSISAPAAPPGESTYSAIPGRVEFQRLHYNVRGTRLLSSKRRLENSFETTSNHRRRQLRDRLNHEGGAPSPALARPSWERGIVSITAERVPTRLWAAPDLERRSVLSQRSAKMFSGRWR